MKKLLGLLGAAGLVASTGSAVVSCGDSKGDEPTAAKEAITLTGVTSNKLTLDTTTASAKVVISNTKISNLGTITVKSGTATNATAVLNKDGKTIDIKGIKAGTTEVTVSATNATADVKFTVAIPGVAEAITLTGVSDGKVSLKSTDGTAKVEITNATIANLGNITVKSATEAIATAVLNADGKTIDIKGVKEGTSTVTVKATNATKEVTFNVEVPAVAEKEAITLTGVSDGKVSLNSTDGTAKVEITNDPIAKLGKITVTSAKEEIATAVLNENGKTIDIKGVKEGTSKVTIKATNATADVTFDVVVPAAKEAITLTGVSEGKVTLDSTTGTKEVVISNDPIDKLGKITVTSDKIEFATATLNKDGKTINIQGVAEGTSKVTVEATNATSKVTFDVVVPAAG